MFLRNVFVNQSRAISSFVKQESDTAKTAPLVGDSCVVATTYLNPPGFIFRFSREYEMGWSAFLWSSSAFACN